MRYLLCYSLSHAELMLGFALTAVWVANAIPRPPAKRSAAIGIVNGIGNIGNLYALENPDFREMNLDALLFQH